ncbi:hypothetical protein AB1Y20_014906 [Prymnesium parvum]|uniref:non-specific serine/threonine protein kinase n=1 Tax=Prymnesium parvum TaxID=97485 RepID=A0AB34JZ31_PRYPA
MVGVGVESERVVDVKIFNAGVEVVDCVEMVGVETLETVCVETVNYTFHTVSMWAVGEVAKARHALGFKLRAMGTKRTHHLVFKEADGTMRRLLVVGKQIAEGGYSTLWRVIERQPDGKILEYAVKRLLIHELDEEAARMVNVEIEAMTALPVHPNVLALIGHCRRSNQSSGRTEIYMLMELCRGGSMADLLIRHANAAEDRASLPALGGAEVLSAFMDMCHAIAHLHTQHPPMAHRDIKPENFLRSDDSSCWKLADFGSVRRDVFRYQGVGTPLSEEEDRIHKYSTPQYRAPEMSDLYAGEVLDHRVDIWALGVTLYKLLFFKDLFGVAGEEKLAILNFDSSQRLSDDKVVQLLPRGRQQELGAVFAPLLVLLRACLSKRPDDRPAAQGMLQWLMAQRLPPPLPFASEVSLSYCPGIVALTLVGAQGLFPKEGGSKLEAFALVGCGHTRRCTPTVTTRTLSPEWRAVVQLPAHTLMDLEISIWASRKRLPDAFLGCVTLPLHQLLASHAPHAAPHAAASLPEQSYPLQKRSARSRVSGEVSFALEWHPTPAAAHVAATRAAAAAPAATSGGGKEACGAGSFWATHTPAEPQGSASEAVFGGGGGGGTGGAAAGGGAGMFWDTADAHEVPPALPGATPTTTPAVGELIDLTSAIPPEGSGRSGTSAPPPAVAAAEAAWQVRFGEVSAPVNFSSVSFEMETAGDAAASGASSLAPAVADEAAFWAAFDSTPVLGSAAIDPFESAPAPDELTFDAFGAEAAEAPSAGTLWDDLSLLSVAATPGVSTGSQSSGEGAAPADVQQRSKNQIRRDNSVQPSAPL